jgi:hypothetical protein
MRGIGRITRKALAAILALALALPLAALPLGAGAEAALDDTAPVGVEALRPVEWLTRGLVAAKVSGGVFLSWRLLADEPDGISFNVYRDGELLTAIAPRDVQPESNYATNPGIVKTNVTPTNYTDAAGTIESVYEVAPVIGGVEGEKEGQSVPMLSTVLSTSGSQRAATHFIQLKPAPERVPLANFTYRGGNFGTGTLSPQAAVIPGTATDRWYVVDMDLLRSFREPYEAGTAVDQALIDAAVAKLNEYNTTPNFLGVKASETVWAPTASLAGGKITDALYAELEAQFIKYLENLDSGTKLPYTKTEDGAIRTSTSSVYNTYDMTTGDFDGDGEFEIVVKWRSTQVDPMYSEPIYGGSVMTAPENIDVYKQDGTLLFRVDMGYNIRAGNDHETNLFAGDFDGDGASELMLKTGPGSRIGNWDEEAGAVVFEDTLDTVVGGEFGLNATQGKFAEYFAEGDAEALDTYWSLLNSFTISYRDPASGNGNDGLNNPDIKRWIKTYHVGAIGPGAEYFTAFKYDAASGKGVIVDSADYPFNYAGSVDGENWAMNYCNQRGNYCYLAFPGPGAGSSSSDYKAQMMAPKEAYWLLHPWKGAVWGDAQGNRANRYVGAVASLDGENIYAVSERGYYARTTHAAFRIVDGEVVLQAAFDSADPQYWALGGSAYDYQNRGNHHLNSADLDGDGRDEIVMKAMVLGLNETKDKILPLVLNGDTMPTIESFDTDLETPGYQGPATPMQAGFQFATDEVRNNPLNAWYPLRHGDRGALLPIDGTNKIAMWSGNEEHLLDDYRTGTQYGWLPGPEAHDPLKGKRLNENGEIVYENSLIYGIYSGSDDEGAVAGNFSNRFPGAQGSSSSAERAMRSLVTGEVVGSSNTARGINQGSNAIWFGGGLTHMAVNGANIQSVNDNTFAVSTYQATGYTSSGNKSTPTLKADLLGDWREELVYRSGTNLAIVTTLSPTEYGIRNLMQDPMYRQGVANTNQGYNQIGFASFYLGDEVPLPSQNEQIYVNKFVAPEIPALATPSNILFTPIDTGSVTITWDAVEGAVSYNVYRRDAGAGSLALIAAVAQNGYIDEAVEKAADYYYSVTAVGADGVESAGTNEAFIMTAGDRAVKLAEFNIRERAGAASRVRLADLDGDGRTDILAINTAKQSGDSATGSGDATVPRVVWSVTGFNIEGEQIMQWFANPATPYVSQNIVRTGADEPAQVQDVDGDGYNEIILVGNPTYNPQSTANVADTGDVFYIIDARTGEVKYQKPYSEVTSELAAKGLSNANRLHDGVALANFDGRTVNGRRVNQFVVMKTRYDRLEVFELFDKDTQAFTFKHLWGWDSARMSAAGYPTSSGGQSQTVTGHYPLVVDLDGDGKDELISNYSVYNSDGTMRFKVPHVFYDDEGNRAGTATDHVDTIQVGDVDGDPSNGYEIIFGGGGSGMSTFCFYADGSFYWTNNIAKEPQSLILADFRTEATGLELYGLDRRVRSNYPAGHDGLFLIGPKGEDLYKEADNTQGWSSIVIRVPNWTGTWAPLSLAFFRNDQANAANTTTYPNATALNHLPTIYDGYFNKLFEMPGADMRFIVANFVGDSRDEIVGYSDIGEIVLWANGDAALDSLATGAPRQQTPFHGNYSRYPTDRFVVDLKDREPAAPTASGVTRTSAYIDWTPVIGATSYALYRDGEKLGDFAEVGYLDENLDYGTFKYTLVATDGAAVTPVSYPLTLVNEAPIDRAALEAAIAEAKAVDQSLYTPATVVALSEALAAAELVLADADADQAAVNGAAAALLAAIDGLKVIPDKDDLDELEAVLANFKDIKTGIYTPETAELLKGNDEEDGAIKRAEDVLKNPSATQEDVEGALDALRIAADALELAPELAYLGELNVLLMQIAKMNPNLYTTASWGALQAVVDSAWASIGQLVLAAPMSALALEAAIETDGAAEIVAEAAEAVEAIEAAEEIAAEGAEIADAEAPAGAAAEAAEVEIEAEAAEIVPLVDIPAWLAQMNVALQEAIANLIFKDTVPPAGAGMSGNVTAPRGSHEYLMETVADATAEFKIAGAGVIDAGTINFRVSFKANLYTEDPEDETDFGFEVALGEDIADKASMRTVPLPPALSGYQTYSVYIMANSGETLTLGGTGEGQTLGTGTIADVSVKLDSGSMGLTLASLLVTRLDVVYYDGDFQNGEEGIVANVSLSPSVATEAIRFASRFDVNRDGALDLRDVNRVREYLGSAKVDGVWASVEAEQCDLVPDGVIDLEDLTEAIARYEAIA